MSPREGEILNLAIEGLTDQQIAYRLDISTSTVNSYWVRIRGKLGSYSRTELVASALRQQAEVEMAQLRLETDQLVSLAQRRSLDADFFEDAEVRSAILDALPDPVLALDELGTIVFTNAPLDILFGYGVGELTGKPIEILLTPRDWSMYRVKITEYLLSPHPVRLGIGRVVFVRRKDGGLLRVTVGADGRATSRGTITTCVVRNFVDEIDNARQRATTAWETISRSFSR